MAYVFAVLFALIAWFDRPISRPATRSVAGREPVREG